MRKVFALVLTACLLSFAAAQSLTVWTTLGDESLQWLQDEAAAFTAAFGTEVEIIKIDLGELRQQALLSAPEGQAGDLFVGVPHDQIGELAVGGILADMSTYATQSYLDDLSEQAQIAYTYNGKLFGLPMWVEGPALIVNTDLVSEIPATYEDMIAAAKELTTDTTFGFLYDINNFYFSYNWLHSNGGYVFQRDGSGTLNPDDLGVANEGAITGVEQMKALRFEHELIPAGTNYDVANGQFIDGTVGMIYNGPWAISQYRDAGVNVAVVPMPPMTDGTSWSGFMGVQGVLMNQFSENKVNAANFAKWLTRRDAQISMADLSGRIPASLSALETVSDDPIIAGFGEALLSAEPMPNIPEMGNVWGPMGDALSVINESAESDVSAILNDAASQISGN